VKYSLVKQNLVNRNTTQNQAVREAATICPRPLQVDLWPFDLESGVRVTCDVAYLSAKFSLPEPLCSRLRPDVRVRQTDVRRASLLIMPQPYGGGA